LSSDSVGLVRRVTWINVTILNNNSSIAKNEVHRAIYVAFPVELPLGMDVEGVLVPFKAAPVKY
jgi:hypothetical protein